MSEAALKKGQPVNSILPGEFGLAEHKRRDWVADIKPQVAVDEVCKPEFWPHVSDQLQPLDKIECRWEDGSKIVHLRVTQCDGHFIRVQKVGEEDLGGFGTDVPADFERYEIQYKGPSKKFIVVRKSDKAIVSENNPTKLAAAQWIKDNDR